MSDWIIKRELIEDIKKNMPQGDTRGVFLAIVDNQPTIEAVPVVEGEWISDKCGIYYCSNCYSEAYWDTDYGQQLFNYCPECGARMKGGK